MRQATATPMQGFVTGSDCHSRKDRETQLSFFSPICLFIQICIEYFLFFSLGPNLSFSNFTLYQSLCRRPQLDSWIGKICWRTDRQPTPVILDFPGGSAGKESTCNEGDLDSTPGLGRAPGEGKGHPCQYSGLENAMDCTVHGVPKSRTRPSDFIFHT